MQQPKGFAKKGKDNLVCKLKKQLSSKSEMKNFNATKKMQGSENHADMSTKLVRIEKLELSATLVGLKVEEIC